MTRSSFRNSDVVSTNPRYELGKVVFSVKNHNVSGPHLFPGFTTHAKKIPLPPLGWSYREQQNHSAIGRNSKCFSFHADLSRFVLPISDPTALNFSQFVGFQNPPNLSKTETCEFDGKEPLFVERTTGISIRVLGNKQTNKQIGMKLTAVCLTMWSTSEGP